MPAYIYVLCCPLSGDVRYVGKGVNIKSRLRQHISDARLRREDTHKSAWIKILLAAGLRPQIEVDTVVEAGQDDGKDGERGADGKPGRDTAK